MPQSVSIAVIHAQDTTLVAGLEQLPGPLTVRRFATLYDDFEALREFGPELMFLSAETISEPDLGALRLLRSAFTGLEIAFVVPREREVALADIVRRAQARVLLEPFTQRDLAAIVSTTPVPRDRPEPDTFLDLTRGISDELNNPLMFVSGHLQLLEAELDRDRDETKFEQIGAIRDGLDRIAKTMDKIRLLSRAARSSNRLSLELSTLIGDAVARVPGAAAAIEVEVPDELRSQSVPGDSELLPVALQNLLSVGTEMSRVCDHVGLVAAADDTAVQIRLTLSGHRIAEWQLPRTFEPYYANRILRGSTHGLSLFLVQTILHGHGGHATARRRPDGAVEIELTLPKGG